MAAFDRLRGWQFGPTTFPVSDYSVRGGIRDHVHEYPHAPGGAPEKLGRKLYDIHATALFIAAEALTPDIRAKYPSLFPTDIRTLRTAFENQLTLPLTIPTIGTIDAYAVEWDERKKANDHSGLLVEITWREDQDRANLSDVLSVDFGGIAPKLDTLNAVIADVYRDRPGPSIWEQINSIALQVLAIKDSSDLYGSLVAAKIDGFASLLRQADQQVDELNHPDNQDLTEALHDLWSSAVDLQKDVRQTRGTLREYTVPFQMAIGDVSTAIFGDATHAVDVMQLNPIEDPLEIPAGMILRYFPIAA
jgi:hypothetical protein